jgi:hypothetical protein
MRDPVVHTIDERKVFELLKVADPYLKNYVRALKNVSRGWEDIAHKAIAKLRNNAAQNQEKNAAQPITGKLFNGPCAKNVIVYCQEFDPDNKNCQLCEVRPTA